MTPDNTITNKARVSIVERLVPSISYAATAVSGAFGSLLIFQLSDQLRKAETAGITSFLRGTSEIELAVGIMLLISAGFGGCAILVSVVRLFTTNTKASPPGALFLFVGLLSLVPAFVVHYALHMLEHAALSRVEGGISSVEGTVKALSYFAPAAALVVIVILIAFSFIPFSSRIGRKYSPVVFLIIVEIAVIGLAGIFFWQAIQAREYMSGPLFQ